MSNDSFKYYIVYILYYMILYSVQSGKLATMATGHATPINLHLFE